MAEEEQKDPNIGKKLKEGISMREIETFARKYTNELLIIIAIFVASISSIFDFFIGSGWAIFFAGLCVILGIAFPGKNFQWQKKIFTLYQKQEKTTQIIIGIVRVIIALFLPFVIFAEMGFLAGAAYHKIPEYFHKGEGGGPEE